MIRNAGPWEIVRFVITGAISAAVYVAAIAVLLPNLPPHTASVIPYIAAMSVNYWLQRVWTFRHTGQHRYALPRYLATHIGGIWLNAGTLYFFTHVHALPFVLVQIGALGAVAGWSYLLQKVWVFRPPVEK